jgi:hypothetical protein
MSGFIQDPVFGELGMFLEWEREMTVEICGRSEQVRLSVDGDDDGKFQEKQYAAYTSFMQDWGRIQQEVLLAVFDYYNQRRIELGYDEEEEESYPFLESAGEILEHIELTDIIIPNQKYFEAKRIGLAFACTWDEENGAGVRLLDEKVDEVGFNDVSF